MEIQSEFDEFLGSAGLDTAPQNIIDQRTDEWQEQRKGLFTGSRMKELMSCKSRSKKDWTSKATVCDLGDAALNYIVEKTVERMTGIPMSTIKNYKSAQMIRGTELEGEAFCVVAENLGYAINQCSFIKFLPNAGASPDGEACDINGEIYALEIKCPETPLNHAKYVSELIDESHDYFWQLCSEVMAIDTDKAVFVSYDPRFPDGCKLAHHVFMPEKKYLIAIKMRCAIAEEIIKILKKSKFRTLPWVALNEVVEQIPENWIFWLENYKYGE